jgi:hypothetical protein
MSVETELGTASTYVCLRPEALPNFPPTRTLFENHVAGHANPLKLEKPEALCILKENAFSVDLRIRRAAANGGVPDLSKIFESAGWKSVVSTGATKLTGTPTVSELIQASNVVTEASFVLVERSAGVHVPVFVNNLATATITPQVKMSAAPSTDAAVNPMYTFSPVSTTGFKIASNKTLNFILNTYGFYDDAFKDHAERLKGCALASIGEIVFGTSVGTIPTLNCTFHGVPVDRAYDDMAADSFGDGAHFGMITPDCEFSIQAASAAGDIALVSRAILEARVNLGINVVPMYNNGGTNVGGATGYMLMQVPPTVTVKCRFTGDAAFEKKWLTELEGSNTSACIQLLQPTRDIDHPAFAFIMPNAHMAAGQEPTVDVTAETIEATVSFTGDVPGVDSDVMESEIGAAPIYFGISNEAS